MPDSTEPEPGSLAVLVVEDMSVIALDLQMRLEDAGYRVLGPVGRVDRALSMLERETPDVAVLDLNLQGEPATAVAKRLKALGVPFIVASGDASIVGGDAAFAGAQGIAKPIQTDELLAALGQAVG